MISIGMMPFSTDGAKTLLMLQFVCVWTLSGATAGREFYLVFMERFKHLKADDIFLQVAVSLSNPNTKSVETKMEFRGLSKPPFTLTVDASNTITTTLTTDLILSGSGKHSKCVYITSSEDVYAYSSGDMTTGIKFSSDGFAVLPTDSLGLQYVVATHCVIRLCVFAVTSVEDDNSVEIKFRITSSSGTKTASYSTRTFGDDDVLTESLNKGESIQVLCETCDMTGTLVTASKKVAVISGGQHTKATEERPKADAVAEQMIPVSGLGSRYVLGSNCYNQHLKAIVKVVSLRAKDQFTFDGKTTSTLKEREVSSFVILLSSVAEIVGTSPLLVVEIIFNEDDASAPDVSMNMVLPHRHWQTSYDVFLPKINVEDIRESLHICLLLSSRDDVNQIKILSGGAATETLTRNSGNYAFVSMTFVSKGLRHVQCESEECKPFWGFVLHSKRGRTASYTLMEGFSVVEENEVEEVSKATTTTAANVTKDTAKVKLPACGCHCVKRFLNVSVTEEHIVETKKEAKAAIKKALLENKKTISSFTRRKESAADKRPSSQVIGIGIGISVSVIVAVFIFGTDLIGVVKFLAERYHR